MRRTVAVSLSMLAIAAAGCSSDGNPVPATSSPLSPGVSSSVSAAPSSAGQPLPYAGAPKVANPLPPSVLAGDPCEALTPEQVTQALGNANSPRRDTIATGPFCSWFNSTTSAKVTINYVTQTHQGLSGVYANTKPKTSTWKELPLIDGFPAVAHDFTTINCQVSIGVADDLSVDVTGFLSSAKQQANADPCEAAAKAAALVVGNLKKKAGS